MKRSASATWCSPPPTTMPKLAMATKARNTARKKPHAANTVAGC